MRPRGTPLPLTHPSQRIACFPPAPEAAGHHGRSSAEHELCRCMAEGARVFFHPRTRSCSRIQVEGHDVHCVYGGLHRNHASVCGLALARGKKHMAIQNLSVLIYWQADSVNKTTQTMCRECTNDTSRRSNKQELQLVAVSALGMWVSLFFQRLLPEPRHVELSRALVSQVASARGPRYSSVLLYLRVASARGQRCSAVIRPRRHSFAGTARERHFSGECLQASLRRWSG